MPSINQCKEIVTSVLRKSPRAVFYVVGKPGMGKSDMCYQVGDDLDIPPDRIMPINLLNHDVVDFTGVPLPAEYIVHVEPEGGAAIGEWLASGRIGAENRIVFEDVPTGRYLVYGHPNPSSDYQKTDRIAIDLRGGQTVQVLLQAK